MIFVLSLTLTVATDTVVEIQQDNSAVKSPKGP